MASVTTRRSMSARCAWIGGLVAVALVAAGCGGGDESTSTSSSSASRPAGDPVKIAITDFKYIPDTVTVPKGTRVEWTNNDVAPHTATSKDEATFDTGTLRKGQAKALTLSRAGTYEYFCRFHAFMTAKVVVK